MGKSTFLTARYRLEILDLDGERFNGTCSPHDLKRTERLAIDILKTVRGAAAVRVSTFDRSAHKLEMKTITLDGEEAHEV